MTIREYYENYKQTKKLNVNLPVGKDVTVKDFYKNCIAKNALPIANVLAWHKMFMEYIKRDDAIFWIRYYESGSKKSGRWNTRRGCKTRFEDGFSYVFVSNFDAHEIFNMVRLGVKPDVNEFADLMKTYSYPLHYESGQSCEEVDIAAFPRVGTTRGGILTPDHWYLAHVVGIKSDFYDDLGNKLNVDVDRLYSRGVASDWSVDSGSKKVRNLNYSLSEKEKSLIKAHFLRFVDPLNYYAAPGRDYQLNDASKIIGEAEVLNNYMASKYADIYGIAVMSEFRKAALASVNLSSADENAVVNVSYGTRVVPSSKTKGSRTSKSPDAKKTAPIVDMSDYIGKKIGTIVKTDLKELLQGGRVTDVEIAKLQTKEYSKEKLDISYPLLVSEGAAYDKERYYSPKNLLVEIKGKKYVMCSQWFETEGNNDRPYLIKFIKEHMD